MPKEVWLAEQARHEIQTISEHQKVLDELAARFRTHPPDQSSLAQALHPWHSAQAYAAWIHATRQQMSRHTSPRPPSSRRSWKSLVLDIVEQVTLAANRIEIWLNRAKIAAALEAGGGSRRPDIDPITLSIEAKLRRAGKGKRLVIANGAEAEVNAGLVELIKGAFTIRIQLLSGSDDSIEAMSGRLGTNKCRLTSLIRLSYLAPDIVRALLEGRQPIELTPTRLLRLSKDLPHDWSEQRHVLGYAA